jgi:hypothetical protein
VSVTEGIRGRLRAAQLSATRDEYRLLMSVARVAWSSAVAPAMVAEQRLTSEGRTMNKRIISGLLVAAALGATGAGVTHGAGASAKPHPLIGADASCFSSASIGSGPSSVNACVSAAGTIDTLQYALSGSLISNASIGDSYQLCSNNNPTYYEDANGGSGWGTPTVTGSLAAGTFKSTRSTNDGQFKLVQQITMDKTNQGVVVKDSLTNTSAFTQTSVQLGRLVDVDADNTSVNNGLKSQTQVVINNTGAHGVILRQGTLGLPAQIQMSLYNDASGYIDACLTPVTPPSVASGQDLTARVVYPLGTIKPGATKNVVFHFEAA